MTRDTPRILPRAPRFALPGSMLYRLAGDLRWRVGRTENISRSGVLFHAAESVELEAPVEMLLDVPVEVAGDAAGAAICQAWIVRYEASPGSVRPALAAALVNVEPLDPDDPRRI